MRQPAILAYGDANLGSEARGFASEAGPPVNDRLTMPATEDALTRMMDRLAQSWPYPMPSRPAVVVVAGSDLVTNQPRQGAATVPLHLLLDETLTDDELAFWLARQLIDQTLQGAGRTSGGLSALVPSRRSERGRAVDARVAERADQMAFDLLLRANYDAATGAERALNRLRSTDNTPPGEMPSGTETARHNADERLASLARYVARVYATQDVTRPATDDALRDRFIHTELNEGRIVEDAIRRARLRQSEGDTSSAIDALQPALTGRFAREPVILNFAAGLHALRGDIDQADALYTLADQSPNQTREGLAAHIRLLNEAGRPDDARRLLELRRQPDPPNLSVLEDLVRRDVITPPVSSDQHRTPERR